MQKAIIFILFLMSFPACLRAAEDTITIAVDLPYPPFAYIEEDTGRIAGFDVDIANAICGHLKIKCEVVAVEFKDIIPQMAAGKIDVCIAGMGITPERKKQIIFGDKYYRSSSIFVGPIGSGTDIDALPEGSIISVQAETLQEEYLKKNYKDKFKIEPMSSFFDILDAVKSKKADMALMDGLAGYHYLKADFGLDLDIVGEPVRLSDDSHIALRKGLEKLRDRMNQALQALRDSGAYDAITRKYFSFNIY